MNCLVCEEEGTICVECLKGRETPCWETFVGEYCVENNILNIKEKREHQPKMVEEFYNKFPYAKDFGFIGKKN